MDSYLNTSYFKSWKRNRKWLFYKYACIANILHVFLLLLGFKKLMSVLVFFQKKPVKNYTLHSNDETLLLKKAVNPIFKRIRRSKYLLSNCFSSSILLWYILKNHGLTTQLKIGIHKKDEKFKAHAWIEFDAFPLNENLKIREKHHTFEHYFI